MFNLTGKVDNKMTNYYASVYPIMLKFIMEKVNEDFPCDIAIQMIQKMTELLNMRMSSKSISKTVLNFIESIIRKYSQISNWNHLSKWLIKLALELLFEIPNKPK
eukprot:423845_1